MSYGNACASGAFRGKRHEDLPWLLPGKAPERAANLRVEAFEPQIAPRLVFSTLDAAAAGQVEKSFATFLAMLRTFGWTRWFRCWCRT
jgi:hypothetical protein